MIFNITRLP